MLYYNSVDDVREALEWTRELLQLDPQHARALGNIPHYEKAVAEIEEKLLKRRRGVCI